MYIHLYIPVYVHPDVYVHLDIYSPICPRICSPIYIYIVHLDIYIAFPVYMYSPIHIYIYIYIAPYFLLGNWNLLFHINLLITHSIIIPFVHSLGSKAWILIYFIIIVVAAALSRPHGPQPTRLLCPWILQGRTLEWVAMLFSRGSPRPTQGSNLRLLHTGGFFTTEPPGKP